MGCDIHIMCEVFQEGRWQRNKVEIFPNRYFHGYRELTEGKDSQKIPDYAISEFLANPNNDRQYDWFAILADVRNGRGFAGIKTGEGFAIISKPRGIPNDCCLEWQEKCMEWREDFHSHSYHTLADFESFDWNQICMKTGVISLESYKGLRNSGDSPESYSGGVFGGDIKVFDTELADKLIDFPFLLEEGKKYFVRYDWAVIYSDCFSSNIENIVKPMRALQQSLGLTSEQIRLVFAFDN